MDSSSLKGTILFTIIVPAHNEEIGLKRCLPVLTKLISQCQVVVVANGCADSTVAVAKSFPGIEVIELEQASKADALNAGDTVALHFPRVYLDADVHIGAPSLLGMVASLNAREGLLAAPIPKFDTTDSSWVVRRFYDVFVLLPHARSPASGGVYAMSRAGRARFDKFPDHMGDDLFVRRQFEVDECVLSPGSFTVMAPRDLENLSKVRTRVASGNKELANLDSSKFATTTAGTAQQLFRLVVRSPRLSVAAAIYCYVIVRSRWMGRLGAGRSEWLRDETTR